jgi:hypothetical protein
MIVEVNGKDRKIIQYSSGKSLKELSHEIDFKSFDKNLQNLA